ncbi:MAG: ABC transporter permease [Chitinophagaceae bacterium]|nr:ABC transporter permease [Chitinophagaceae bacterium]
MSKPYNQAQALWAITRASFKAIFNQPTAVVFSLLFPIIFILIFGAFGSGGGVSYRIAVEPGSDTTNRFFVALKNNPQIRVVRFKDTAAMYKELNKGRLTAVIQIQQRSDSSVKAGVNIDTRSTSASVNTFGGFMQLLDYERLKYEAGEDAATAHSVNIGKPQVSTVQRYRQIDFILPGQLGFSILFSTLFGIAFTFFNLREQLVLKRFYASPVKRIYILLGIGMSRLFFQLINVVVLILVGHFFLNFTLRDGAWTFIEMVLMSVIMLFLLMGVGLIFSSIVKSDTSIPLWINLFGFPQMMLSGTFFPIQVFPKWLQEVCNVLPLTQFNDAMRKISFEGLSLLDCGKELGILAIWIVAIYAICARVIKWE